MTDLWAAIDNNIQKLMGFFDRRWGECKPCKLLRNPFYAPASFIARFFVNLATIGWALIILSRDENVLGNALYIYHQQMIAVMPVHLWAALALVAATSGLTRLLFKAHPTWWGGIGYGVLMIFWVYADVATMLVDWDLMSPAAIVSINVVAALSVYAAASHARVPSEPL